MKVLVCTDGSEHSRKSVEKAAEIAGGCGADDVAVIHIDEGSHAVPSFSRGRDGYVAEAEIEKFIKLQEEHEERLKKVFAEALDIFEKRGVKARKILKSGHPAESIVETAEEEGFDTIVVGSRGLGGLKKAFLGSVSNAVIQEASACTVIIVK